MVEVEEEVREVSVERRVEVADGDRGGGIGRGSSSSLGVMGSEGGSPELISSTSSKEGGGYPPNFSRDSVISLTAS